MALDDIEIDVCIIGGSIAGNYIAYLLSQQQIKCIVIEEHKEIGRPVQCAGIISQKLLKLVKFPKSFILNQVKSAQVFAPNQNMIEMSGREAPVVIDRAKFDQYFGELAQQQGVEYYFGEKYITHWRTSQGTLKIKTSKRNVFAKILIGADGPFSRVSRRFNIKYDYIPAVQVRAKFSYNPEKTAMYFNPQWKELFGYIVPETKDELNNICRIGLATRNKPNIAIKDYLKILGVKPADILEKQGGLIPFGFPKHIAFDNTVLLGDSACMVKATTGGGVVMLLTAAKILAPVIKRSLTVKDYSRKFFLKNYQKPIKRGIGIQLKVHYFIRLLLINLKKYDFNHFFKLYQETDLKEVIDKFADMDFPLRLFRKLRRNKAFIQFVVHVFFRNVLLLPKFLHDIAL
jgi:digeranylgeranylglycerophospholipid reductase